MSRLLLAGASALALATPALAQSALTQPTPPQPDPVSNSATVSPVVVTHERTDLLLSPQTRVSVSADQVAETTNVSVVEDELKYLPDVLIRDRHIGDTQAPITTRTSGVGSSARSLVYVDGVLLSALIGNNNSNASPRWGMVSPDAVVSTEVLYGPFAAAYPGNSIGEVVNITTRMPTRLEGAISVEGAGQGFRQYGTDATYPTGRIAATLGDRWGRLAVWLSVDHLDTKSQPLYDITSATPAVTSAAGAPVSGGYGGVNRTGATVQILGAGGLEHQVEDNATLKLAYALTPQITADYMAGLFHNDDHAGVQNYVHDGSGAAVYAGTLNIGGYGYSVPASAFDNDLYHLQEDHLMQSLSLGSHDDGDFDWKMIASNYTYLEDRQRTPSTALPAAFSGGSGIITSLDGSGWTTLDLSAAWRPQGGAHLVSFGAHEDRFQLESPKYNTGDWIDGGAGTTAALAKGKTQANAVWAQDVVTLTPAVGLTLGGRYEYWNAYDGVNTSLSPALSVRQPGLSRDGFSPKAVLAFSPDAAWRLTGSVGRAYRFPTVEELYQAVTTGNQVSVPNPNLKPEDAVSEEVAAERRWSGGHVRLSLFAEQVANALISQSAPLLPGSPTLYSYVQNVARTRVRGVELVASQDNLLIRGLELSGWITYADSKIMADNAYAPAVGKQLPQLPRLRGSAVATYRPTPALSLTAAGRYSDRAYGTIDNSDHVSDTFTGFSAYFVADLHARYRIDPHLIADVGVDNLNGRVYFLYHPFPQRTVVGALKYAF